MSSEKYFLKQVVIIIKEYPLFGLTKIKCKNKNEVLVIDSKLITNMPVYENTLSIRILGG